MCAEAPLDPTTPVLIGWMQSSRRESDYRAALEPVDLMAEAARGTASDGVLSQIDWIGATAGLTHYADPARLVAQRVGAREAHTVLAKIGVMQHSLIAAACEVVQTGRRRLALVVGGEARYRDVRATAVGQVASVTRQPDDVHPDETMSSASFDENMSHPAEAAAGLAETPAYYALIDSFWRSTNDYGLDEHRDRISRMYARFAEIASHNPHAVRKQTYPADHLREPSPQNPMVAFPYTKLMITTWTVDQACALLFTTAATAEALGVPREHWRFPVLAVESNHAVPVVARTRLHTPASMRIAAGIIRERTGFEVSDVDVLDIYSAFPAPVLIGAEGLGVPLGRDLTVTGGMSFAGGPLNNYAFHAVAATADRLSDGRTSSGLVSCVSGYYTKQAVLQLNSTPPVTRFEVVDITAEVAAAEPALNVAPATAGEGAVVAYTVVYVGGSPERAVAVIDLADGNRTVARSHDAQLMAAATVDDLLGAPVTVDNGHFRRAAS